ncbi:MAG TPA: PEGA domain-containing protein [Candidatus Saccharimonadales bacterium]|nr:PEGA domain-containing protein [Candidatus Saccharimonadales bacterium]
MTPTLFTRHRILIISLLVIAVIVIPVFYFVYTSIERAGKTQVTLIALPEDASLTIDGKPTGPGTLYLKPGSYTIKGEKNGFTTYEHREVIENDNRTITVVLNPVSDEAKKWTQQNQTKYLEIEGKAGLAANQEGEAFRKENPIVNDLPYSNYLYTIGYQNDNSDPSGNSIIVTIDAPSGYRNAAVRQIRALGYDPATLKIEFRNYESPF